MHDSALVTEVLEKVKLLLPDIVRDCVTTALGIHNATGKPTADKVSPSDAFEKRLHSLERQIKKINESIKSINKRSAANFKTLYDEISRCENLTDKSKKELTALRGSISSLQKQCNKLKNVHSSTSEYPIEKDTDNASVILPSSASLLNEITKLKNTLSSTSVNSNPDILTIKEDIMNLKKKMYKIDDIEHFQNFVSDQYDCLSKSCVESSKLLSDVENGLRVELQKGLVYLENEFLGEEGKLTSIRKNVLNDISNMNKDILDFKESLTNSSFAKQSQLDKVKETLERYEQYIRRNCLEIHGVIETPGESTNDIAIDIFRTMNVNVNPSHIDRSHRLRRKTFGKHRNLPDPIIVKLVNHDVKDDIFEHRDILRKLPTFRGIFINENLTSYRRKLYREVRSLHNLGWTSWTRDGVIKVCEGPRSQNPQIHSITNYSDFYKIVEHIGNL